jgi:hypothetical protein
MDREKAGPSEATTKTLDALKRWCAARVHDPLFRQWVIFRFPETLDYWNLVEVQRPVAELVEQENVAYHGAFYFDLMETLLKRLVYGLAHDLGKSGVSAVAIAPGFMRTEAILEGFGVTEANWRDALDNPQAATMGWGGSETPCFVGRAVAALAGDPQMARKNGGIYTSRALAAEYGFTDIDGQLPAHAVLDGAVEQAKKTFLAPMIEAGRFASVDWMLAPRRVPPP